jgi:lipopolysaccharide/colanic/teichoic acid biosynthesis glycosyltransferase
MYFEKILSLLLLLFLSPFMIILAVIIIIDSKGPIIFKQSRVGKNGRIFRLYKFRTMYNSSDRYTKKPLNINDSRITGIGRILRQRGLDEIPQLINIIKGEMSLIGPRPEMPFIVESYNKYEKLRLSITPGITGLWQVLAQKEQPIHKNLEYDLYYIRYRCIKLDIWIAFQTIKLLFGLNNYKHYEEIKGVTGIRGNNWWNKNALESTSKSS